jgi:hypothetical protein
MAFGRRQTNLARSPGVANPSSILAPSLIAHSGDQQPISRPAGPAPESAASLSPHSATQVCLEASPDKPHRK